MMRANRIQSKTDCRILVLYRVDVAALAQLLPENACPREINGWAIAGILLARRCEVRSPLLPARLTTSATAVHFANVLWQRGTRQQPGVFVARRDTSSRWRAWIGSHHAAESRQHHARFRVREADARVDLVGDSDDAAMHIVVRARLKPNALRHSVFRSAAQAMDFLRPALVHLGMIRDLTPDRTDVRPRTRWRLQPLEVEQLECSLLDNGMLFPSGQVQFDSAFWLSEIELSWDKQGAFCCDVATA